MAQAHLTPQLMFLLVCFVSRFICPIWICIRAENPLHCSCDAQKLWEWLRDHRKWSLSPTGGDNINYLRCEHPTELRGKVFGRMEPQQFCDAPLIPKMAIQDIQPYSVVVSWQSRDHLGLTGFEIVYHATGDGLIPAPAPGPIDRDEARGASHDNHHERERERERERDRDYGERERDRERERERERLSQFAATDEVSTHRPVQCPVQLTLDAKFESNLMVNTRWHSRSPSSPPPQRQEEAGSQFGP